MYLRNLEEKIIIILKSKYKYVAGLPGFHLPPSLPPASAVEHVWIMNVWTFSYHFNVNRYYFFSIFLNFLFVVARTSSAHLHAWEFWLSLSFKRRWLPLSPLEILNKNKIIVKINIKFILFRFCCCCFFITRN